MTAYPQSPASKLQSHGEAPFGLPVDVVVVAGQNVLGMLIQ